MQPRRCSPIAARQQLEEPPDSSLHPQRESEREREREREREGEREKKKESSLGFEL